MTKKEINRDSEHETSNATNATYGPDPLLALQKGLESLQARIIDAEAYAHAAAASMDAIPYVPRSASAAASLVAQGNTEDIRWSLGRLQTYTLATAGALRDLVRDSDQLLDEISTAIASRRPRGRS